MASHYWDDDDEFCFATGTIASCVPKTTTRLKSDLATLQAKLDAMVGERELERAVVDRAVRLVEAQRARIFDSHEPVQLAIAVNDLLAARAKGGA